MRLDLTIVLLAGGRATRLPGKLGLRIGSESMLERAVRQLSRSGYPLVLSVRHPLPDMPGVSQVADRYEDAGPLGGLASAAAGVTTPFLFAAAADLPNLDEQAVEALVRRYQTAVREGTTPPEAVVPRHPDGSIEPLAALYDTKALRASSERTLRERRLRVSDTLAGLRVVYHDLAAVEESRYHNVNTAEDFARIEHS